MNRTVKEFTPDKRRTCEFLLHKHAPDASEAVVIEEEKSGDGLQ